MTTDDEDGLDPDDLDPAVPDDGSDDDDQAEAWGAAVSSWASAAPRTAGGTVPTVMFGETPPSASVSSSASAAAAAPEARSATPYPSHPLPSAGAAGPLGHVGPGHRPGPEAGSRVAPSDGDDRERAAAEFARTGLRDLRATAGRWAGAGSALLAAFGAVAVVAGPTEVDRISRAGVRWAVLACTVLAGVAAVVSLALAGWAARAWGVPEAEVDGEGYRSHLARATREVARLLFAARISGFVAATAVFCGGVVMLAAGAAHTGTPGSPPSVLVVRKSGQLVCGPVTTEGVAVTVGGRRIGDVASITVVTSC